MLFNSAEFLFIFLPLTLLLFQWCRSRVSLHSALLVLITASLFFYAWWKPVYLLLLSGSIVFNFSIAKAIYRYPQCKFYVRCPFGLSGHWQPQIQPPIWIDCFNFMKTKCEQYGNFAKHIVFSSDIREMSRC